MSLSEIRSRLARGEDLTAADIAALLERTDAMLGAARAADVVTEDPAIGAFPPTPIMRWLFDAPIDWRAFVQSMWIQTPAGLDRRALSRALEAVIAHHPVLRLRVTDDAARGLSTEILDRDAVPVDDCLRDVSIAQTAGGERLRLLSDAARAAVARIDPAAARVVQSVWFEAGPSQPGRLFIAIHHLAIDGVSWRILLSDLRSACEACAAGRTPVLPAPRTSFRAWAQYLEREAAHERTRAQLPYWEQMLRRRAARLTDAQAAGGKSAPAGRQLSRAMTPALTAAALDVPARLQLRINDVLLTALSLAVRSVCDPTGETNAVAIELESHGRTGLDGAPDVSGTLGWFTTTYPIAFEVDALATTASALTDRDLIVALTQVKQQLRSVPDEGVRYGLLRYSSHATRDRLRAFSGPEILFNYMGRFATAGAGDAAWTPIFERDDAGDERVAAPIHPLEVNAVVVDGPDGAQLQHRWQWQGRVDAAAIERIAAEWEAVLTRIAALALQGGIACVTPADFPLVALTQTQVDALRDRYSDVTDVWPVTPLQRALLPHALGDAANVGIYNIQVTCAIDGLLEPVRLRDAVETLLQRHDNLCAAFDVGLVPQPVQVIVRAPAYRWTALDLTGLSPDERRERLTAHLIRERIEPFDVSRPLLRFLFARIAELSSRLVITTHHLVWDGWSTSLFLRELGAIYGGDRRPPSDTTTSYRDYVRWLSGQDAAEATAAWRRLLEGLERGTVVDPAGRAPAGTAASETVALSDADTAALETAARAAGATLNACVELAWSIALAVLTDTTDVVFGVSVAGRPPELPGSERLIGLCANTVPLRVRLLPAQSLADALRRMRELHADLWAASHVSLPEIQRAVGIRPLFDTMFSFESYPAEAPRDRDRPRDALRFSVVASEASSHFPLNLLAAPGSRLSLRLDVREPAVSRTVAQAMLGAVAETLRTIAHGMTGARTDLTVADLIAGARRIVSRAADSGRVVPEVDTATAADRAPTNAHPPQHDAITYLIAGIFAEVLGVPHVGPEDSFFDRGGDSLIAVTLIKRVRDVLDVTVPIGAIMDAPRPCDVARMLDGDRVAATAFRRVLPLRRTSGPVLCCLPPAGGLGWPYARLLRDLDADLSIVCVQDAALTDDRALAATFDAAIESYLASLREATAAPYCILGWSFGGRLAHAIACRLIEAGEAVAALIVVDTYPPAALAARQPAAISPHGDQRRGTGESLYPFEDPIYGVRVAHLMEHNAALAETFQPSVCRGDMLLLSAAENAQYAAAWQPHVAGELRVQIVDRPHTRILQAREIGAAVQSYLRSRLR